MSQDGLTQNETNPQPAMELMGGDAADVSPAGKSLLSRFVRGTVYGSVMLVATALLAISAVPELARYSPFASEDGKGACPLSGGCSTLDPAALSELSEASCEAGSTQAVATESCGGCPLSRAALVTGKSACCQESASLVATEGKSACCAEESACCAEESACCADKTESVALGACCKEAGGTCPLTAGASDAAGTDELAAAPAKSADDLPIDVQIQPEATDE